MSSSPEPEVIFFIREWLMKPPVRADDNDLLLSVNKISDIIGHIDTLRGVIQWQDIEIQDATRMIHDLQLENPAFARGENAAWEETMSIIHQLWGQDGADSFLCEVSNRRDKK